MFCKCGSNKIENRDLCLCASCNRLNRASTSAVAVKERKSLAQVSPLRSVALKARQVAYKEVKKREDKCACCGTVYDLTPSHVLTQKKFPDHAADPFNVVVLCAEHHNEWEHDKASFRKNFPAVWERKMNIMQVLEPAYYEQFKAKHGA